MVIPCQCTGSIEFAHEHCMKEWIKRRVEADPKSKASCEVCSSDFNYRKASVRTFDCEQLGRNCKKHKKSLVCFAVVYSLLVVVLLGLIGLVVAGRKHDDLFISAFLSQGAGMTVLVSIIVLFSLAMVVVMVLFLSEYVVRQDVVIDRVLNYQQPKSFLKNYRVYFKQ